MRYAFVLVLMGCPQTDSVGPTVKDTGAESPPVETDSGTVDTGETGDTAETGDTGDSTDTDSGTDTAPPPCDRSLAWRYVACGIAQTCGIHTDGCAECWGRGEEEDAGGWDTGGSYHWNGEDIPPEGNYSSIAMISTTFMKETRFACGILVDGSAVCWGADEEVVSDVPSETFLSVAAWEYGVYGILSDGSAVGWGNGDAPSGQFSMIATGLSSTVYLKADGTLLQTALSKPNAEPTISGTFTDIGIGNTWACAISTDGGILCWYPDDPANAEFETLTLEAPVGSFVDVCNLGGGVACVLDDASTVTCWGYSDSKYAAPAGEYFSQLACGSAHACGVTLDGRIVCWGADFAGETVPPS